MRLLVVALVLVIAVLGAQTAAGGGDFVPRAPADPCASRSLPPVAAALEPLTERLVLVGLDATACDLGVSRERLALRLAAGATVEPEALRAGLLQAADDLEPLPAVSALLEEALALSGLPGIVQDAAGAVPDAVVDDLLPTRELLRRAVTELDVGAILTNLEDPAGLEPALRDAILTAGRDQVVASVRGLLP